MSSARAIAWLSQAIVLAIACTCTLAAHAQGVPPGPEAERPPGAEAGPHPGAPPPPVSPSQSALKPPPGPVPQPEPVSPLPSSTAAVGEPAAAAQPSTVAGADTAPGAEVPPAPGTVASGAAAAPDTEPTTAPKAALVAEKGLGECEQPLPGSGRRELEAGFTLGAGVAVGVLNLPSLGAGPTLFGRLATADGWAFELTLDRWLDNEATFNVAERDLFVHPFFTVPYPPGGSRMIFDALEAGLAVCPHRIVLSPGELALCAGVRGGVLRVEAEGLLDTKDEASALFAVEVHARWHYRLAGPIGISYSAGLFVPFLRDRFVYLDAVGAEREKFRQAPLSGRLDLALTYTF